MRRSIPLVLLFFLFRLTGTAQSTDTHIIPGECLVMLHGGSDIRAFENSLPGNFFTGFSIKRVLSERYRIILVGYDPAFINPDGALAMLKDNEYVALAQHNHTVEQRATPNDANFTSQQWALNNTGQTGGTPDADIDAPEAWNITTGGVTALGDTIVVAVVDGGFQMTHPDLVPNLWRNYDEISGNGIDDDGNGYIDDITGWDAYNNDGTIPSNQHGTHVAGIVGARGNNSIGVSGVNWNVKIMTVAGSSGTESVVVAAYAYIATMRELYNTTNGTKGAFVVSTNASFGVDFGQPASYPIWCAFYDTLGSVGILNAGAGPNANTNIDTQGDIPTTCPSLYLIAVTNTTNTDARNSSCGYGPINMDIGAPGTSIYSTYPTSTYQNLTGTSMATPHVTGAIGLYYSAACSLFVADYKANPSALALQMRTYLLTGVDSISSMATTTSSHGRLNLYKGILRLQTYNCVPPQVPVASFTASDQSICPGDSVNFTDMSTNNPTSWAWTFSGGTPGSSAAQNPTVVYTSSGTYDVQLIASNNGGSDTINLTTYITVNTPPAAPVITYGSGMLQSSYPSGNQWYDSNGIISGATSSAYTPPQNGDYYVVYTDANGCTSTSAVYELTVGLQQQEEISFSVYPNPVSGFMTIKGVNASAGWSYRITDITGKVLVQQTGNSTQQTSVDMRSFNAGIYLVQITSGNYSKTLRIVKL